MSYKNYSQLGRLRQAYAMFYDTLQSTQYTLIFFCLCSTVSCGVFSDPLPKGVEGPRAEQIADQMLNVLNRQAFMSAEGVQWSFRDHHYLWHKKLNRVRVQLDDALFVYLDLNVQQGWAIEDQKRVTSVDESEYVQEAIKAFNNDSFWAFAPFKIRDPGTSRAVVKSNGRAHDSLLVFYQTGGSTPGDHYLWHFNENGRPIAWQMWVDIIPVGGVQSTWDSWQETESGAWVATSHDLFMGLHLSVNQLKVTRRFKSLGVRAPRLIGHWPMNLSH